MGSWDAAADDPSSQTPTTVERAVEDEEVDESWADALLDGLSLDDADAPASSDGGDATSAHSEAAAGEEELGPPIG